MGGVVAFVTKSPEDFLKQEGDDFHASVKAGYASADKGFSETLTFANRSGRLETMLIYTRRDNKETNTHSGDDVQGLARGKEESLKAGLNNVLAEARYQLSTDQIVGVKVDWLDQSSKSDLEAHVDPRDRSKDARERQRITLSHDWDAGNRWFDRLHSQLSWQNTKSNQVTYTYGSPNLGERKKDYFYEQGGFQLGTQFNKQLDSGNTSHSLTYGFSWRREDLENHNQTYMLDTGELLPPDTVHQPGRYSPLATNETYGIFLQDEITFPDQRLTLTPGIRYDSYKLSPTTDSRYPTQFDDNKGEAFTAKLGALYRVNDKVTVYAAYSQGFRAPTLDEAYYAFVNDLGRGIRYGYEANPDLKPEESDSYELGVRVEGDTGAWELTAFSNDYKNFIEEVVENTAELPYGAYRKENIAKAKVEGVEFKGELWLDEVMTAPAGITLHASIAYAEGENQETGKPLQSIAPLTGVFGLNYDHTSKRYGGALNLTVVAGVDERDVDDESRYEAPGYGVVDLTAYYSPVADLTLRAGLFNIANKKYWKWEDIRGVSKTGASPLPESGLDRYAQPGRNFSVSAKYVF